MTKFIDITGNKYNGLTAIKRIAGKYWLFKCDCGKEKTIRKDGVVSGRIKSCGCLWDKNVKGKGFHKTHNHSNTRIYKIWQNMKDRCYNKNNKRYRRYGGRGIKICKGWLDDFSSFYNWAINNGYKQNLTIDRINNNGNYCPENCRWATQKEQSRNVSYNHWITYRGKRMILEDWLALFGKKTRSNYYYLNKIKSMSDEEILDYFLNGGKK